MTNIQNTLSIPSRLNLGVQTTKPASVRFGQIVVEQSVATQYGDKAAERLKVALSPLESLFDGANFGNPLAPVANLRIEARNDGLSLTTFHNEGRQVSSSDSHKYLGLDLPNLPLRNPADFQRAVQKIIAGIFQEWSEVLKRRTSDAEDESRKLRHLVAAQDQQTRLRAELKISQG